MLIFPANVYSETVALAAYFFVMGRKHLVLMLKPLNYCDSASLTIVLERLETTRKTEMRIFGDSPLS